MIVRPRNWRHIGREYDTLDVERVIDEVIMDTPCNALALSGGVDSSLLLYFMSRHQKKVRAYTIGCSEKHPDVIYAREVCKLFDNVEHIVHIPKDVEKRESDLAGDEAVREFYRFVSHSEESIVTGDGIDEFMCGYYSHQNDPTEETYYKHIRELVAVHLVPLDKNSSNVRVYLPYLDERLISIMSMIPISDKVNSETRKMIIFEIASSKLPYDIVHRRKYGFCHALNDLEILGK